MAKLVTPSAINMLKSLYLVARGYELSDSELNDRLDTIYGVGNWYITDKKGTNIVSNGVSIIPQAEVDDFVRFFSNIPGVQDPTQNDIEHILDSDYGRGNWKIVSNEEYYTKYYNKSDGTNPDNLDTTTASIINNIIINGVVADKVDSTQNFGEALETLEDVVEDNEGNNEEQEELIGTTTIQYRIDFKTEEELINYINETATKNNTTFDVVLDDMLQNVDMFTVNGEPFDSYLNRILDEEDGEMVELTGNVTALPIERINTLNTILILPVGLIIGIIIWLVSKIPNRLLRIICYVILVFLAAVIYNYMEDLGWKLCFRSGCF